MIAYNLFNRFDAGRKEKALRRNREQFVSGGLTQLPPQELCDGGPSTLSHMASGL
jgi:hypothetical protein